MPCETASSSLSEFFPLEYYFSCQANIYFYLDPLLVLLCLLMQQKTVSLSFPWTTFSKLLIGLFSVLQPQVLPTFLGNGVSSLTIKVVSLITLIFFFNGSGCFGMNTGLGITSLNLLWDLEQVHYTHEISMFSSRKYGQKPWVSVFILSQTIYKKYLSGSEPLIFLQE